MTRLEKIRTMPVEKIARLIMDSNIYGEGFCKEGKCSYEDDDTIPEESCLGCCIEWLNEEESKWSTAKGSPAFIAVMVSA